MPDGEIRLSSLKSDSATTATSTASPILLIAEGDKLSYEPQGDHKRLISICSQNVTDD